METDYKYFKFIEGRYFRLDEENDKFQILNDDNLWEDSYDVESLYDDPAIKYIEITDQDTINKLKIIKTVREFEISNLTIDDYETRFPNSNQEYFNNLSNESKQEYIKLYLLYYDLLYKYLIPKLNLKQYDNMLLNSDNVFYQVPFDNMDLYQRLSSNYLKYFYLRNNIYIERLTKEELGFLKKKLLANNNELDQETITFIENTYQKVMLENTEDVFDINYGPEGYNFYEPSNNIIIGVRFGNYYKDSTETESEWNKKYNDKLYELELIIKFLAKKLDDFIVPCSIIIYNNFSIKKLSKNDEVMK